MSCRRWSRPSRRAASARPSPRSISPATIIAGQSAVVQVHVRNDGDSPWPVALPECSALRYPSRQSLVRCARRSPGPRRRPRRPPLRPLPRRGSDPPPDDHRPARRGHLHPGVRSGPGRGHLGRARSAAPRHGSWCRCSRRGVSRQRGRHSPPARSPARRPAARRGWRRCYLLPLTLPLRSGVPAGAGSLRPLLAPAPPSPELHPRPRHLARLDRAFPGRPVATGPQVAGVELGDQALVGGDLRPGQRREDGVLILEVLQE